MLTGMLLQTVSIKAVKYVFGPHWHVGVMAALAPIEHRSVSSVGLVQCKKLMAHLVHTDGLTLCQLPIVMMDIVIAFC